MTTSPDTARSIASQAAKAFLETRADSDPNSPWLCPRCNHFAVEEIDAMTEATP